MEKVRRDEPIDIWLTLAERELILNHTLADDDLVARVRDAKQIAHGKIVVKYTPDELNELLEFIAAEANHTEDRGLERRLDNLYDRLEDIERALVVVDD